MTIESWNELHPIGSTVTVRSLFGELEGRELTIAAPASLDTFGVATLRVLELPGAVFVNLEQH